MMSKPVKTSISRIDGEKIYDINTAQDIRDNKLLKRQKGLEAQHKESFDYLWDKYMLDCKNVKKLAYNTILRKEKMYKRYLEGEIKEKLSKTNKDFWATFIKKCDCSDKQKNHILKELKAFMNWCINDEQQYLLSNPCSKIPKFKISKTEIKYWTPEELTQFLKTIDIDLESTNLTRKEIAETTDKYF